MAPPSTPETQKFLALQKSVRRFFNFSAWLHEESERTGETVSNLTSPENRKDTVCRFLSLDPEKIREENIKIMEHLASISEESTKENS